MTTPANPLVSQFAAKIRSANPGAYEDLDATTLAGKVVNKFPQYADMLPKGFADQYNTISIGGKPVNLITGAGAETAPQMQATQVATNQLRQAHGTGILGTEHGGESSQAQDEAMKAAWGGGPSLKPSFSGPAPQGAQNMPATAHIAQSIPALAGAIATFAPGTIAASMLDKVSEAVPAAEAWQKINTALGVKPSAIRIGENATEIADAATNPGRTLAKMGLDADTISAMQPIERQAAIAPHLRLAGQAVNDAIQQATDAGTTLDIGKSTFQLLKNIKGPAQQTAIDALKAIQDETGIENLRKATPTEARAFRDALRYGARFNTGGDLSSLGGIRANLYRAASGDLENAVPGLDKLNEAFSDLKAGAGAARNQVATSMVKPPPPPPPTAMQQAGKVAIKAAPYVIGTGVGGAALRAMQRLAGGNE